MLRLALAVALAAAPIAGACAGASPETSTLVLTVTARAAPQPTEISCPSAPFSGASRICITPGSTYRWRGAVRDAETGLAGRLTGRCSVTGRADGSLSGGVRESAHPLAASASFSLFEFGQAIANCSFVLTFPRGSLFGTAAVSSTLQEADATGRASESVTLSIVRGTGIYSGRTGRGDGKLVTTVPPTTVNCVSAYACRLPVPLVIPRVDTQDEAWHVTLR